MSQLADNIKNLRKINNYTQLSLSKKLGIARSTVSLYESGKRVPSVAILRKMSTLFGVSLDQLFGDDLDFSENFDSESLLPVAESDKEYNSD